MARATVRALEHERDERPPILMYHMVPDLSRNIGDFTGGETGPRPRAWISMIKGMQRLHNWPPNYTVETARSLGFISRHILVDIRNSREYLR